MADTSGLPPEGWYPDRPNATRLRHWNGTGWTNEFRPIEVRPATPAPSPEPVAPVRETTDARSRRELRAQVGTLAQGEPDAPAQGITPMARAAEPVAVAPTAPVAPVAPEPTLRPEPEPEPEPTPEPAPTLSITPDPEPAELTAVDRARVAGGYQPTRKPWQESFTGAIDVPTGSSQTFAGWLFAASPLWIAMMLIAGMTVLSIVSPILVQAGFAVVAFAMTFLLARQDTRHLIERGYRAPSVWWVLLPFFYFVARTVRVGARSLGMLITYVLSFVALLGLLYLAYIGNPALLSLFTPPVQASSSAIPTPVETLTGQERDNLLTQDGIEAQVRLDLAKTFEVGTVTCEPFASIDPGTTTTCVVELDGTQYNAGLQVTPDDPAAAFAITGLTPVEG